MTADGKKIHFKGPGAWRSQADAAQADSRPPAAVLEPPAGKRRVPVSRSRDLTGDHRLVLAEITRCGGMATTRDLRSRRIVDGWEFSLGAALSALVRTGLVVQEQDDGEVTYRLAGDDDDGG